MSNIIVSDDTMVEFFNNWVKKLGPILEKENKSNISELNNLTYFFTRNIEKNYDTMLKNLQLIFGENAKVDKQVAVFDETLEFLQQVIQVEGADRLFSKHFYGIEWNMFLEADFEKSEMKIYRDHFLHQIRNAYFGFLLIWELDLYKNITSAIQQYDDTGFATLINMYSKKETNTNREVFYAEVIKKTWFIAALFHDIGYPISYYYRFSSKMDKYMPYLRVLDKRSHMDFVELAALLCDSYLFKIVEYDELKQKYDKLDHGMMSAICLLLNYYHSGLVHKLSPKDRCAIELAAYAIYVHTRKYSIQQKKKESKWVKPSFVEDPIAYLLRICDDLQEWSRIYFIISKNNNILVCNKCGTLVKKSDVQEAKYECECGSFQKLTTIDYRKINLVSVCDDLEICDNKNELVFKLNYNLLKLLEVIELDKQYAKYRYKEMKNLEKLFDDQILLPRMRIESFLSNNPRKIKMEIVKRLLRVKENIDTELTDSVFNGKRKKIEEDILNKYKEIMEERECMYNESFGENIKAELDDINKWILESTDESGNYIEKKDFILDDEEISNNDLKNIYVYKIIYDILEEEKCCNTI